MKKMLEDSEYPIFRKWVNNHEGEVVEGTYIQAYLKQRKRKLTDW